MGNLFRYLLILLFIIIIGAWIVTVNKSCNVKKDDPLITETAPTDADSEGNTDPASAEDEDAELEDLYEEVVGEEEDSGTTEGNGSDEEEAIRGEMLAKAEKASEEGQSKANSKSDVVSSSTSTDGKFMVIAGSYLSEFNAKNGLKELNKKGYNNAEIVVFDHSQYHTLCAERTSSLNEANTLKNKIKAISGFEQAYVHKKRSYKK